MSSYELDKYFPLQGTCFRCGRDLRHKVFDKINSRFSSGDSIDALANVYNVPKRAIELVIEQNAVSPLGITFSSTSRARAATV